MYKKKIPSVYLYNSDQTTVLQPTCQNVFIVSTCKVWKWKMIKDDIFGNCNDSAAANHWGNKNLPASTIAAVNVRAANNLWDKFVATSVTSSSVLDKNTGVTQKNVCAFFFF